MSSSTETQFGNYDFGLADEEETRAARLHAESIIIDQVWFGPCTYLSLTPEMEKELDEVMETTRDAGLTMNLAGTLPVREAISGRFPEFKKCWDSSGLTAGSRSVEFSSWERFSLLFGSHISMFDNLAWVIKALRAEDIRRAKAECKHAAWISTQLSRGLCTNFIDFIEPAYNLGLRMIQLTYNSMNSLGAGCTERTDAGVSHYGAKVIALMNELGIIVDTAHCGRQTTLDACKLSTAPVVASHTSAQRLYNHIRAKTDEELHAIADSGGVIGVYMVPFFLSPPPVPNQRVGMEAWLDHIDYITNLVGWEYVSIGTDWPMPMPKSILKKTILTYALKAGFRKEDRVNEMLINLDGFDDYRDFPNVTRGLVKRGYTDKQIKGILGENFLRVFKDVCG